MKRRENGVPRPTVAFWKFGKWEAHLLTSGGFHYVHGCDKNAIDHMAARGGTRKRCPLCRTIMDNSILMATKLQVLR